MSLKILHVIPYYAPAWAYGGTPRAVFEIAKEQVFQGHQVSVWTTDAFSEDQRFSEVEINSAVTIYRSRNLSNWLCWNYHFAIPTNIPDKLKQQQFDVIHLHEARTTLNYLALNFLYTKKYVFSPWGTLPFNNSQVMIKKMLDFALLPLLQSKVSVSFAQTNHEAQVLNDFGISKKISLVPLGIDISFFTNLPSKSESRKYLEIDQKTKLYVYLGRFSPFKGIQELVLLAKFLSEKPNTNFLFLLVGRDDGFLIEMQSLINQYNLHEHVKIHPPLYDRDRLYAYRAADIFISLPTVYEETSTTCLESLACGTPVITNQYSEIPYSDKIGGVLHLESVENISSSEVLHKYSMMKINQRLVTSYFDWKSVVSTMNKSYE